MKRMDSPTKQLVAEHLTLVGEVLTYHAKRYRLTSKSATWDDAYQCMALRLMACASRYQPQANVPFRAYAWSQLSFALVEYFREEAKHGFNGSRGQKCEASSLDQHLTESEVTGTVLLRDPHTEHDDRYRQRREAVQVAVSKLPTRLGFVVRALYLERWRVPDIARALGVSLAQINNYRLDALDLLGKQPALQGLD